MDAVNAAYRALRAVLVSVVGLAACIPASTYPRGKQAESFAVRWNSNELIPPGIEHLPASVGEFARAFVEPWRKSEQLVLLVMGRERVVRTCRDLLAPGGEVGQALPPFDWDRFLALQGECGSVKRMVRMRPGRRSHLSFAVMPLVRELGRVRLPGRPGALDELLRAKSVECEQATSCNVWSDEEGFRLEAVAYGDFDGDGVMDLMLQIGAGQRIGAGVVWYGMVLTRHAENGPLVLLDAW